MIKPAAVIDRAPNEAEHWHLSNDCFNYTSSFAQNVDWDPTRGSDFHALFGSWQTHPEACTFKSLLLILYYRLDNFYKINELYNLTVGDNVRAAFARDTGAQLRKTDSGGRWSATGFLYVLPATDAVDAKSLGDTFRSHFMHHPVNIEN